MKILSAIVLCLGMGVVGYFLYDGVIPVLVKFNLLQNPSEKEFSNLESPLTRNLSSTTSKTSASESTESSPPAGEKTQPLAVESKKATPKSSPSPETISQAKKMTAGDAQNPDEGAEPAVIAGTTPLSKPSGSDPIVSAMQTSIKEQQISQFKFHEVKEWTSAADESIDGTLYQIGIASFETTTIFGSEVLSAKALIQNGKVDRWVWPRSGMEIR